MSGELLKIVLLCGVAVIVLYRLKSVIGTRTGYEAPPEPLRPVNDDRVPEVLTGDPVEPETDGNALPDDQAATLAAIREAEPDFSVDRFLQGARGAYEMILMAYEEGDRKTLQSLLAPDVFSAFEAGIEAREAQNLRVDARFVGVQSASVEAIEFDAGARIADVTIRFVGELITAVRDQENRVVEGDPNEVRRQSDLWTFSREMGASDPNWLLTATSE